MKILKTNFTNGPWLYNPSRSQIYKPGKNQICKIWNFGNGEGKANANLISAAPEMYTLLEELMDPNASLYPLEESLAVKVEAVLEKARGE